MAKKATVILSVMLMSFFLLTGCGSQANESGGETTAGTAEALSTDSVKTLGDVNVWKRKIYKHL